MLVAHKALPRVQLIIFARLAFLPLKEDGVHDSQSTAQQLCSTTVPLEFTYFTNVVGGTVHVGCHATSYVRRVEMLL